MCIETVMPSNHLTLCLPLLFSPSIFPRSQSFPVSWLFTPGGQTKYWSFQISPSDEYSGLISFRIDCLVSLQSKGLSRVSLSSTIQKHRFFSFQLPASEEDIRDKGSVPGLGRSPGGGHGNPLQYSYLESPMDREAWWL